MDATAARLATLHLDNSAQPSSSSSARYIPPHRRRSHAGGDGSPPRGEVMPTPPSTHKPTVRPKHRSPIPQARRRLSESELPTPSAAYLEVATGSDSTTLATDEEAAQLRPLVVVMPVNNTLVTRLTRDLAGSRNPIKRPYLSTLLAYLFSFSSHSDKSGTAPRRAIQPVVFSGMRAHNILALLKAVALAPPERQTDGYRQPYIVDPEQGDILSLVLAREDMGLGADYYQDVETVKDLRLVWEKLGIEEKDGATRTVLLNDTAVDAAAQPYSLLPISTFRLYDNNSSDDLTLLSTIGKLDALTHETNVAAYIHEGGTGTLHGVAAEILEEYVQVDEARFVERGREVCEKLGIPIVAEFEKEWWRFVGGAGGEE
ncbi:hypothetical protein JCM10908_007115 [Rhodotorula pacifica]|uniref:uncharacterized protein n=1 Tax=Rhodotorula pacifica TaxID=1495444 RepID=UPI00316ED783